MTAEASGYLAAVKWADEAYYLRDFVESTPLPQVAKVIKGTYGSVGVPSLSAPSLNQVLFWTRPESRQVKLTAQCVKFKERGSGPSVAMPFGPRLAIANSFEGWFEILSEEGRAVRVIESVAELARRFPDSCLVRDNVKCLLARPGAPPDQPQQPSDRSRVLQCGDTLVLVSTDVIGSDHPRKSSSSPRYLEATTGRGERVFLSLEAKGKFSPIAKEDNISGVHTVKNLLTKRLPLMARMVVGKGPGSAFKAFVPELRLLGVFEEDTLLGMPLFKEGDLISVPLSTALKVVPPKNAEQLSSMHEYKALAERCARLNKCTSDQQRIEVVESRTDQSPTTKDMIIPMPGHCHDHKRRFQSNCVLVKRCISDYQMHHRRPFKSTNKKDKDAIAAWPQSPRDQLKENATPIIETTGQEVDDKCYDEIDQIYDYVRGFAPLPDSVKAELAAARPSQASVDNSVQRRLSYPTIVHDIAAKRLSGPTTGMCSFSRQSTQPHPSRAPMRSNSTGKLGLPLGLGREPLLPTVQLSSKPKLFVKSGTRNVASSNLRLLKYAKSPTMGDVPKLFEAATAAAESSGQGKNQTNNSTSCRSNRSLSTSPLFNIRYKSLNNLHLMASGASPPPLHLLSPPVTPPQQVVDCGHFADTLDSSNSGGSRQQTSSSTQSAGSKDPFKDPKPKNRKLSRPKSLTNLFWDMAAVVSFDRLHNELNTAKSRALVVAAVNGNNVHNGNGRKAGSAGSSAGGSPHTMSIERISSPDGMASPAKHSSSSNSHHHQHTPSPSFRKLGTLYL